jgi:hypothetical protein
MGTTDEHLLDLDWLSDYLGIPQRSLYNWRAQPRHLRRSLVGEGCHRLDRVTNH